MGWMDVWSGGAAWRGGGAWRGGLDAGEGDALDRGRGNGGAGWGWRRERAEKELWMEWKERVGCMGALGSGSGWKLVLPASPIQVPRPPKGSKN